MRCQSEDQLAVCYSRIKNIMEKDEPVWSKIAGRMLLHVIPHPFEYAKVLIQIGYEPIKPWPTTYFGSPALALPNILQYVRFIKSVDGFTGCYRGLVPKICANTVYSIAFEKTVKSVEFEYEPDPLVPIDDLEDNERDKRYVQQFFKTLIARSVGIILSQPFEVVAVRMMAQFVGGETKYMTLIGSFAEIYRQNGISGYFSGLVPKLIASATTVALVSTSTYIINKYFIQDREMRTFTSATMTFLASTITYPFLVVSQCMAVNNSGLVAGEPPLMPIYADWTDCWRHLSQNKQLKRGSSLIWRYYTGPTVLINNKLIPTTIPYYSKKD